MKRRLRSGFSAIELMITLFIGFMFMAMGFQLYTVVMRQGANENAYTYSSFVVEAYMRAWANNVPINGTSIDFSSCPATYTQGTSTDSLGRVFTYRWECPDKVNTPTLRKLTVIYQIKDTSVSHATYLIYAPS